MSDKEYQKIYNDQFTKISKLTDQNIIYTWKHAQTKLLEMSSSIYNIIILVCEDILRQRGNTYLDDHYPKDWAASTMLLQAQINHTN